MSYASLEAVYAGIQSQLVANDSSTISLADFAVNFVPIYLQKKENGLDKVQQDVEAYLRWSMDFSDPTAPAQAAMYNELKSVDTSVMDTGTSAINDLIENAKSEAQENETDLQNSIAMQQPVNQFLQALLSTVASIM